MRTWRAWIIGWWLLALPALAGAQGSAPAWETLQKQYAVPAGLALEATREKLSETDDVTLYKVTYRSTNNQKVPALLFLPRHAKTPMPAVVLQHGLGGAKENMLSDTVKSTLVKLGYAGFAIDAAMHGERKSADKPMSTAFFSADKSPIYQTVVDLRRAVDYLETVPEVDAKRIGYFGVSMGGILGAMASGVDSRYRATVLVVAGGDYGAFLENSDALKQATAGTLLTPELVRQIMADVDPVNFVGHISPRPVLMENGKTDAIIPAAAAEALHKAAREPKTVRWYPGGHNLYADPDAIKDAVAFLQANLK